MWPYRFLFIPSHLYSCLNFYLDPFLFDCCLNCIFILVAVSLLEDSKPQVGIGLYHSTNEEVAFMAELQHCISKEVDFKKITQEMLTPPLVIDSFYERSFYSEWTMALSAILVVMVLLGCWIEGYGFLKNKRERKKSEMKKSLELQTAQL